METFILYHSDMKSQTYSALFWILTENTASLYVVAMAVLKGNQQMTNLWADSLDNILEWKILLTSEILLGDHQNINGKY